MHTSSNERHFIYFCFRIFAAKELLYCGFWCEQRPYLGTVIFPPEGFTPVVSPPEHSPMKSMHGNNVVWLCAKYAVDANLFRLDSSILTRAKRAKIRNNVGGEYSLGEYTVVERSLGNFPGGSKPRTPYTVSAALPVAASRLFKICKISIFYNEVFLFFLYVSAMRWKFFIIGIFFFFKYASLDQGLVYIFDTHYSFGHEFWEHKIICSYFRYNIP